MGSRWQNDCHYEDNDNDDYGYYGQAHSRTTSLHEQVLKNGVAKQWAVMSASEEVRLVKLTSTSPEFTTVQRKVHATLNLPVSCIVRVQNPYLWGCYLLKLSEYRARGVYPQELELFHCTKSDYIESIVRDNLDWRRTKRAKFGIGVCFSPKAQYANRYANLNIGNQRAMILCKVLVGRTVDGNEKMKLPPKQFDTSLGYGTNVYVKYYDYEFYPAYVVYYVDNSEPIRKIQRSTSASSSGTRLAVERDVGSANTFQSATRSTYSYTEYGSVPRSVSSAPTYQGYSVPNINTGYALRSAASTSACPPNINLSNYNPRSAASPRTFHTENKSLCTIL